MLFLLTAYFTRVCGCKDTNILQHILKKIKKYFILLYLLQNRNHAYITKHIRTEVLNPKCRR